ncbi:MAG: enoyl-CoA hydratase-related protein [Stellaceae bacterium]
MGFLTRFEERPEGGRVARLIIDNPEKLNSLNSALMAEIVATMAGLAADPELRLAILTGAGGRAFAGGADLAEIAALDHAGARRFITLVHRCCDAFRRLPTPVIARIDGFALGAGLELAAACDLRVASENSVFGMPEVRVGIPSVVEAALLPRLIGDGRARRLLLTGETIGAAEALTWGADRRAGPERPARRGGGTPRAAGPRRRSAGDPAAEVLAPRVAGIAHAGGDRARHRCLRQRLRQRRAGADGRRCPRPDARPCAAAIRPARNDQRRPAAMADREALEN